MNVEDKARASRTIVETVDKIMEIFELDLNAGTYSIAQEWRISKPTFLNNLHKYNITVMFIVKLNRKKFSELYVKQNIHPYIFLVHELRAD